MITTIIVTVLICTTACVCVGVISSADITIRHMHTHEQPEQIQEDITQLQEELDNAYKDVPTFDDILTEVNRMMVGEDSIHER